MNNTQKFLRNGGSIEQLTEQFAIKATYHDSLPLVILKYSQTDSPKTHPIVRECRGLTLNTETWDIAACAFPRFFNLGEDLDNQKDFNWSNFVAVEKIDGSLILLYWFDGEWRVNTSGSFADGECGDSGESWKSLVFKCLKNTDWKCLAKEKTYVLEYVGPWNKIVREYKESALYHLATFDNRFHSQDCPSGNIFDAGSLGILSPEFYKLNSQEEVVKFVNGHPEATYEGVVLCDDKGQRIKVKNARYVSLHQLKGNGVGFSVKHLLPYILHNRLAVPLEPSGQIVEIPRDDIDEICIYFPEVISKFQALRKRVDELYKQMISVWDRAEHWKTQKDFALSINGKTPFVGILFQARQKHIHPSDVWKNSEDLILKVLENK